jgi:hypothetical protein
MGALGRGGREGVKVAIPAARVNSAATVCAIWVKTASGEAWVGVPPPGRLHDVRTTSNRDKTINASFFIVILLLFPVSLTENSVSGQWEKRSTLHRTTTKRERLVAL